MILADTSVWVEHLRHGRRDLAALLELGQIGCHPAVIGEVALGSLRQRATILAALGIRNDDLFYEHNSRMERLTGVAGTAKIIPGVLS